MIIYLDKMAEKTKWLIISILAVCLALSVDRVTSSQDVMKKMTLGLGKVLEQCKAEMALGDHVMQDFVKFWREEYDLLNRDTGCAIMCLATKLDLVSGDSSLHHGNAQEFAMKHGADADTAKQLVTMVHECEKMHAAIADDCTKVLEIAKCFRTKIHALKWAPDMETLIEELLTTV